MDNGFQRQTVYLCRSLCRPAYGNGSDREDQFGQLQCLNNHLGVVGGSTQIADAQTFFFGCHTECLRNQQSIHNSGNKPFKIVISRFCLPLLAPFAKTAQVDAKSKDCRRRLHHRLIEMRRCQPGFPVSVTGYNYAIHLHVSNRRSTERGFKQII